MTTPETSLAGKRIVLIRSSTERARQVAAHKLPPPEGAAKAALRAATRPVGIDRVTLRIDPMGRKSRQQGSRR
ncbi:MAG: hypothetical protein RL702_2850 [Pseudomonadota bacterium]|jgi:hypothetical protein|nr:hypothetical protein [Novosphingobium sp.]HOA47928.1 hypothetical protein [Novosphingobium sp.]HPB23607.1 hypothetical protein [Novosphingobium sp.]HPZ47071.1 hypothetical protein [Novosphingobium sp.]HQE00791.1 hypothetical protein [Novosphingobium sp.]